jgi:uncharacterized protein YbjT (DUF2867 family)
MFLVPHFFKPFSQSPFTIMKYVISGASGHIGSLTAKHLLAAKHEVVAIGRDATRLAELEAAGATLAIGDLGDEAFMTSTLAGADAFFALIPPNMVTDDFGAYQRQMADAFIGATKASGVKNVVILSSIGAHLGKGAGVVDGLGYLEQVYAALPGVNVLSLRAAYFMENLFNNIGLIKQHGILTGSTLNPDVKLALVATSDIGDVAAKRLAALDFTGFGYTYIAGPADLSFTEVATILGQVFGLEHLPFVPATPEQFTAGMLGYGLKQTIVDGYLMLFDAINTGSFSGDYTRTDEYSTPTTLADFATQQLLPYYQSL